jgi:hypothetical protein
MTSVEFFHLPRFRREIRESGLPPRLARLALEWVEHGFFRSIYPEDKPIMEAIITNDLRQLIEHVSATNTPRLATGLDWLRREAPSAAFFSPKALEQWPLFLSAKKRQNRMVLDYAMTDLEKGT